MEISSIILICAEYLSKCDFPPIKSQNINDFIEDIKEMTFEREYSIKHIYYDKRCPKSYGLFDLFYFYLIEKFDMEKLNILSFVLYAYGYSSYINTILRNNTVHPFALCMDYIFDHFSYNIKEPILVFRGVRNKPEFDSNISGYISCTTDIQFAAFFSHEYHKEQLQNEGFILQITLPIETKIIYRKSEDEIILERNKYKYIFKENIGRYYMPTSLAKINILSVRLEKIN